MAREIRKYGDSKPALGAIASQKPSAEEVDTFHTNSDVDIRAESQHHTLGVTRTQAAPGDHTHDGNDSSLILSGLSITGSRATDDWRQSVNQLLVRLGATDNSTP